jgi:hypothetical protein
MKALTSAGRMRMRMSAYARANDQLLLRRAEADRRRR